MSFSITNFKAKTVRSGGARPSLFSVEITSRYSFVNFTKEDNILVKATSIPTSNIAQLPVNYGGRAYKLNGFRTFDNWTTTVINDENYSIRNRIQEWMRSISGSFDGERSSAYGDPVGNNGYFDGTAVVKQYSVDGNIIQTYKLHNIWPTVLGTIAVDWSSDAIQEYTIDWCYDYWTHGSSTSDTNVISKSAPSVTSA